MRKKWPPEIIQVEWVDSVGTTRWGSIDERVSDTLDEHLDHISVGYLVKRTKNWVALTHSIGLSIHNVCDTIQIPMRAVKKIYYLKANQ